MSNNIKKKPSSLVFKERKIKTTVRYHSILTKMDKVEKNLIASNVSRDLECLHISSTSVKNVKSLTLRDVHAIPHTTIHIPVLTQWFYSYAFTQERCTQRHLYQNIHSSFSQMKPNLEISQVSICKKMENKLWCVYTTQLSEGVDLDSMEDSWKPHAEWKEPSAWERILNVSPCGIC